MPPISKGKVKKINELILSFLYHNSPNSFYTYNIAQEIIRDEEFTKKLLHDLAKGELVVRIDKSSKGVTYLKRERWRLTNKTFKAYSQLQ